MGSQGCSAGPQARRVLGRTEHSPYHSIQGRRMLGDALSSMKTPPRKCCTLMLAHFLATPSSSSGASSCLRL